ncbi:MerR family transcriptional regulator [Rathayibacter sp. CAU 1779]
MLIGEVAERSGVSVRMVRHYANAGLVSTTRDSNEYRDFDEQQVGRVQAIRALLLLGLTVSQIRELVSCLGSGAIVPTCPAARATLLQRLGVVDTQIGDLLTMRERIVSSLASGGDG